MPRKRKNKQIAIDSICLACAGEPQHVYSCDRGPTALKPCPLHQYRPKIGTRPWWGQTRAAEMGKTKEQEEAGRRWQRSQLAAELAREERLDRMTLEEMEAEYEAEDKRKAALKPRRV